MGWKLFVMENWFEGKNLRQGKAGFDFHRIIHFWIVNPMSKTRTYKSLLLPVAPYLYDNCKSPRNLVMSSYSIRNAFFAVAA